MFRLGFAPQRILTVIVGWSKRPLAGLSVLGVVAMLATGATGQERLSVFAAASLKNALDAVNEACSQTDGAPATISYAASSALARQIEAGAPADIFISADLDWMDYLSERKLTRADTETRLLGNRLVLIAPAGSGAQASIGRGFDLAALLGDGRLAMGNVQAVPAGRYGKAALELLGLWASVEGRLAQAENVRAALKLVATGEAPLGIVYETDAAAEPDVRIVGAFPEDSHPPIIYPMAELAESDNAGAGAYMKCLQSAEAKALFEANGFTVLAPVMSN